MGWRIPPSTDTTKVKELCLAFLFPSALLRPARTPIIDEQQPRLLATVIPWGIILSRLEDLSAIRLCKTEYSGLHFCAKGGIIMATAQMPKSKVDPVKAGSRPYTVEFENDKIRVVRVKYGAKEKSVMHSHPESVSVFLNDCKAKFTYPDGKSENIEAKAGQVMHMEAFEHDPENLGGSFELIQIELKR